MRENQNAKISLVTIFLIISVIIIVIMGIFMFKFYNEKTEEAKKATELQTQVDSLTNTANNLQEKINNISETINSDSQDKNTDKNTSNNNISFTDEQVKNAISNYLELNGYAHCDSLLDKLAEVGKISYDPSKDDIKDDGNVTTTVKFSDYKKVMLNYVSENEFNKNWTSALSIGENDSGYITKVQGGGGLVTYTIDGITKINDTTYSAKTTATLVDGNNEKNTQNYKFTISTYNNRCVIDSAEELE